MTHENDHSQAIRERVAAAAGSGTALAIEGSGSKGFLGREPQGEPLSLAEHTGIVNYEPTELVLTARTGTRLEELEHILADAGQMLPFEPPQFDGGGTLGGAIASGLSGPARPFAGSARDLVLGCRLVNGRGEDMHFGGEVMKNVAGYDISRLQTGAMGTLGVLLEVSLKVLPRPEKVLGLTLELPRNEGFRNVMDWQARGAPVTGSAHDGHRLHLRLSGSALGVNASRKMIGGEEEDLAFWQDLRDHRLPWFARQTLLWRVALPPGRTLPEGFLGNALLDWNGQQVWIGGEQDFGALQQAARTAGGHARLFRGGDRRGEVLPDGGPVFRRLHRNIKQAFDPEGILNPGRLYADL
ncbi:glycolate oxidase subunit GlcE [Alkalilimnicola ehrlichii MLHE-1]|uniref:FAD linked oxidase domain protein n=1 Tax=Alkalilimnicola ehrlichii (strain ATCC BAA-1101 / DSM 17681 / MLHE-1) TaxID=187272 RepID=Q0A7E8_ALKEH|nr:glycolate oxidase subunit GlcE [Alkalilimnicola ehrlichii]ABI57239.1 FAD linked oxidase domain protein [Alkalilimnicola ehrlichii MLHE-1]